MIFYNSFLTSCRLYSSTQTKCLKKTVSKVTSDLCDDGTGQDDWDDRSELGDLEGVHSLTDDEENSQQVNQSNDKKAAKKARNVKVLKFCHFQRK